MADYQNDLPSTDSASVRANAARALRQVLIAGRTIDWVSQEHPEWTTSPLSLELIYGTLRHYYALHPLIDSHLKKPLRQKDQDLYALLLVGAYQLGNSSKPAHAILNETVSACKTLRKDWARGLINGILRNLQRAQIAATNVSPDKTDKHTNDHSGSTQLAYPEWLHQTLQKTYGRVAGDFANACMTRAPMCLRINQSRITPTAYAQKLTLLGIEWRAADYPESIILQQPQVAATLPGWAEGEVSVQDSGALNATHILLGTEPAEERVPTKNLADRGLSTNTLRILDACAAPGGKLFHLLEHLAAMPSRASNSAPVEVLALEISPKRISATHNLAARLRHKIVREESSHEANLVCADATSQDWWDGNLFDHILLDAPCSGTGTLRRHPDIKILLDAQDISEHARLQGAMLSNLWQTLAPGGTLLYCTCSVLPAENDDIIDAFMRSNPDGVDVLPIHLGSGQSTTHGWQLLPTNPDTDGFYYSLVKKKALVNQNRVDQEEPL